MRFLLATLFLMLGSFFTYAQSNISNEPTNKGVISGNFDIDKGAEHINIVYIVYPVNNNKYVIELTTANPMALSTVVMDNDGNKVAEFNPIEVSHSYTHSFDVKTPKAGGYLIYVKHEGNLVKTIATKND